MVGTISLLASRDHWMGHVIFPLNFLIERRKIEGLLTHLTHHTMDYVAPDIRNSVDRKDT